MFRPALPCALLGVLSLSACSRTADNFTPRIVISGAEAGVVAQSAKTAVRGYVLDDTGTTQITVDGQNVPIAAGSRKIANFSFEPQGKNGKTSYLIKATDAAGHVGNAEIEVVIDAVPPQIKVRSFTRIRNIVRISGVALDNNRVTQILIDGNRLNITPGQKVEFYAETTGIYADLEAVDAAGNRTKFRAQ